MASLFFSYSHVDEALRDELEKQLSMLKRQGVIEVWHDRRIGAGQDLGSEISKHVEDDDILLLLVSPDFMASEYCYEREMLRAMERHEAGDAIVIPVILRPCDWHGAPFGKLLASPTDGRPVTKWPDRDEAFLEVAMAVRGAAARIGSDSPEGSSGSTVQQRPQPRTGESRPRSSNLRVTKHFTDRDKHAFQHDAFEFMARFFESSIGEIAERNSDVEGSFRRIDANRFTAVLYRNGQAASECTVFMGGGLLSGGISYVDGFTTDSNTYNENLHVDADEQKLFLRSMGMASLGRSGSRDEKLTMEGASELYWSILVKPLQR